MFEMKQSNQMQALNDAFWLTDSYALFLYLIFFFLCMQ